MKPNIDWKRKLTSRKLWIAVAAFASGMITALGGKATTAETVAGCILQGAAVLGYLLAEGLTDAAGAAKDEAYSIEAAAEGGTGHV